jgi:putative transposon-encoded protein
VNVYKHSLFFFAMKKEDFKINPWDVEGEVDYEKLVKEFGVKAMKEEEGIGLK